MTRVFGGFCFKWPFQGVFKWHPFGWSTRHLEEAGRCLLTFLVFFWWVEIERYAWSTFELSPRSRVGKETNDRNHHLSKHEHGKLQHQHGKLQHQHGKLQPSPQDCRKNTWRNTPTAPLVVQKKKNGEPGGGTKMKTDSLHLKIDGWKMNFPVRIANFDY